MPKFLKILFISLASVFVLVLVIIAGIYLFVDPNDYKDEITSAVQDSTGRELVISGDISLSIFPWIGLSLGKTALSNAEGFADTPFASVDSVDIKVKLLPLLQQRLEMQKIRLHGLQAFLEKDKTGRSNWEDLATSQTKPDKTEIEKTPEVKTEATDTTDTTRAMGALTALAIEGLELKDGHIEWNDQQTNQHIIIDNLAMLTGPLALPEPVDLSLSLDLQMNQPAISTPVEFNGQVLVDLAGHMISLDQLQLEALGMSLSGQVDIKELDKIPQASGQFQLATFSPREMAAKLGIQLPETRDAAVLGLLNARLAFNANPDEASLNTLSLKLDDTEVTGSASVKNFAAPAIRFDLRASDIDVDRYLPPATEESTEQQPSPAPTPGTATAAAGQLPLEPLRQLDIEGTISLDKLKIMGARLTEMNLGLKGKSGQLRLHPVQASLYSGHYNGDIGLDLRTDIPRVSINEKLDGVNVGPLLKDVMDDELISGNANISAQMTTSGIELDTIKQSLNGKASFSFHDGKVKGVNIGQMIREAYAKLNNKPAPPKTENVTDFAEMSGSVVVTNGVIRNEDLNAKSPLLRITGEGKVDLPRERINYLVNAAIVESHEGQAGKELEELKSLTIPVKVTGDLTNPKFSLDLAPVLQQRAKREVEKKKEAIRKETDEKIEEEKKKVKKKLEDELKKLLKF